MAKHIFLPGYLIRYLQIVKVIFFLAAELNLSDENILVQGRVLG